MAYYCNECAEWISSKDSKMAYHNGNYVVHKYCNYDRKYRAADQNIFGCRGFVYVRRVLLTKVCEILNLDPKKYFSAFDETKDVYVVPTCIDKLIDYNTIGPVIAEKLDQDERKEEIANCMLNDYIIPAEANARLQKYEEAVSIYQTMIKVLAVMYNLFDKNIENNKEKEKHL